MSSGKPTVFFSHSSRDSVPLFCLKEIIIKKTGGSVDIFLSSDGQSIPFGHNWVHSIENALKSAQLVFVFLTPSSLAKPGWINFEAGHAYSKDIQVVPVGLFGVGIENISPPLSLLQGFNINSRSSASNIIAIINKIFGFSHNEELTEDEFNKVFNTSNNYNLSVFGELSYLIDEIKITDKSLENGRYGDRENVEIYQNEFLELSKYFKEKGITHSFEKNMIATTGLSFELDYSSGNIKILIDSLCSKFSLELLDDIKKQMPTFFSKIGMSLSVIFIDNVYTDYKPHKITAKIYNTDVKINSDGSFTFKACSFSINHTRSGVFLEVSYSGQEFKDIPFYALTKILFDTGVLYLSER